MKSGCSVPAQAATLVAALLCSGGADERREADQPGHRRDERREARQLRRLGRNLPRNEFEGADLDRR